MARKPRKEARRRTVRSADQREWNRCVALASRAWEALADEQRLAWNTAGKRRRISGHSYFTGINAPRIRDGLPVLTEVPTPVASSGKAILKGFVLSNWRGQITLKLEVSPPPSVRVTVWASRPRNQGVSFNAKCPRLGELPQPAGGMSDITAPYFEKHGEYIEARGMELVGKRIFVRVREESGVGSALFEEKNAVVSPPGVHAKALKKC
jgi:hypothetical protein